MENTSEFEALEHVRKYWSSLKEKSPIYKFLLDGIDIVSARHGSIVAHLNVTPVHLNSKGTLHGTVSACLTDWAGGLAIASTGLERTGVSTDIHTTYVSTAKEDDLLRIEGRATKVGSTLGFTTVHIARWDKDGKHVTVCTDFTRIAKIDSPSSALDACASQSNDIQTIYVGKDSL
ncbi:MAG: hypothetical protein Q9217_002908 [Psora testacea]